ncbi:MULTISPECIES: helix-turn-helix domain-containing protein [Enterobacter]|uniref:helix-turn-helix domain-containing protein n=1 Tax=Enterobacter TaxID=547 RepID=UPI001CBDC846|nr:MULTISPECIES: helix-turn-helix domain-containing protein [Enterobacter]UAN18597.1 hypothetical protein KGP20_23795 [Enterobacter asburiae]UAN24714.1 hypothetical protein KGP25_24325 [Enterobacter sp. JBIWA003]
MDKNQLIAAGEAAFGSRWQTDMAEALGVSDRTVRKWVSGDNRIPAKLSADIVIMLKNRKFKIEEAIAMTTEKFLMNPVTGSVDTEENWLSEMPSWDEDPAECQRQFDTLIEVEKTQNGEWVEVS